MFTSLSPGAIGVAADGLEETLRLAAAHGFEGCHFSIAEAARLGPSAAADAARAAGVRLSAFGFPLDFRGVEADFERDLEALPALARTAEALGVERTATWITPASDDLTYAENFALHARRLKPAAESSTTTGSGSGWSTSAPTTAAGAAATSSSTPWTRWRSCAPPWGPTAATCSTPGTGTRRGRAHPTCWRWKRRRWWTSTSTTPPAGPWASSSTTSAACRARPASSTSPPSWGA